MGYTSALSGPTGDPSSRRPTLTQISRRPTKGGRQTPAPRGLVRNGLLIRRRHGWAPTPARRLAPDPRRAGTSLDPQSAPDTPRRDLAGHSCRRGTPASAPNGL